MKNNVLLAIASVSLAVVFTTGCAPLVPPPPVPTAALVVPASPGHGAVWVRGHYSWNRWERRHVWVPGHWKMKRRHVRVIVR